MAKAQALPTMEHRVIDELEDLGARYVNVRDRRIKLNAEEVDLKKDIRRAMHDNNKDVYDSANMTIRLEKPDEEEDVKVKIKKPKAETEKKKRGRKKKDV